MDKIALNHLFLLRLILLAVFFGVITSCSSIEMVSIKNNTEKTIQFRGQFVTKSNVIDNLDFMLKPGDSNLWRYETGYLDKKYLDKGLKKIVLKNAQGCEVVLERDMIEKIAIKDGMWKISIDKETMSCD